MTPKDQSELDQASCAIAENLPIMFRRFFVNLVKEGFTEPQAMELLKTYIQTVFSPKGN